MIACIPQVNRKCLYANAKLYHFPGTRSNRVRWAIHEVGLEVEEVNVDLFKGEQQQAEYKKLNPLGVVPTLIWGDAAIGESARRPRSYGIGVGSTSAKPIPVRRSFWTSVQVRLTASVASPPVTGSTTTRSGR
jgi:hypothetical protein